VKKCIFTKKATMNWFIFWIVIYLIFIVYLTMKYVKSNDIENYLVNNRKTKLLPLVFTTLATFVGGGTSIGLMAMGYESGFAAIGIGIAYVIGFMIMIRYAGKIHSMGVKEKIYSFPHYLNLRFTKPESEPRFARLFSSMITGVNVFIFFFLLAAQFVAMASLLKFAFEVEYVYAAIISGVVIIGYTAFAGLAGVIITDTIQFIIIVLMIIFIFIPGIWTDTVGLSRLAELPEKMVNGTAEGIAFLVALPLFLSWSVLVRMDIWQRVLAAKSDTVARKMSFWSGIGMLPFYLIFPLVGMTIRITHGDDLISEDVTYLFLSDHSQPVLLGFAVVGLLSALMSSGDSFLNIISISTARDFLGFKHKEKNANQLQRSIRIISLVFGVLALFIALSFPKVVDLMVVGISMIVIYTPITLIALSSKNPYQYRYVAFISIILAFVVNLTFFLLGVFLPEQYNPKSSFIPAFIVAVVSALIGMWFVKRKVKRVL
jgi:SSS family solute:Na+ symporter